MYSNYDLSEIENVSTLYENDTEFQKIVSNTTLSGITEALAKAVEMSKDEKNQEIKVALDKLKELGALDENYNIITTTKAKDRSSVTAVSSFDLKGKCNTNAATMSAIYTAYYKAFLASNPITAAANAYLSTGIFFASKVKTGGDWDYKAVLGVSTLYQVVMGGLTYYRSGEYIGNFHYGYAGATIFADSVLLTAAGFVQILSGTSDIKYYSSYFDQPSDQLAIQDGIDSYNAGDL